MLLPGNGRLPYPRFYRRSQAEVKLCVLVHIRLSLTRFPGGFKSNEPDRTETETENVSFNEIFLIFGLEKSIVRRGLPSKSRLHRV